ncbi:MAG: c-type cytochrome [Blastocatellia bacterium]
MICLGVFTGCASPPPTAVENRARFSEDSASAEPYVSEQARSAFRRSCASCHGYDARGITAVAPDLRRARRRSPEEWERYLRDSSGSHPAGQPPPLWINGDELKAIAAYLDSLAQ